jgi:hypothetical protein
MAGTPSTDLVQPGHRLLDQRPHQPAGPRDSPPSTWPGASARPYLSVALPRPAHAAPNPTPTRSQHLDEQPEMNHLTVGQPEPTTGDRHTPRPTVG